MLDTLQAKKLVSEKLINVKKRNLITTNKPIILYGAGNLGKLAIDYLKKIKILPEYIIEGNTNTFQNQQYFEGIKFLKKSQITENEKKNYLLLICIVNDSYIKISNELKAKGWKYTLPFYDFAECYRNRHPLSNGWHSKKLTQKDKFKIEEVIDYFEDDISVTHYIQFLAWRVLREEWKFPDCQLNTSNRFFIPEIVNNLKYDEVYVDVGAHHGSVTERFMNEVSGKFAKIIAIEPDKFNNSIYQKFLENIEINKRVKISLLNVFIDEIKGKKLFYSDNGYASQFSDLGCDEVSTSTIDGLNLEPTFIKYHIEGHELPALKGSLKTITKFRPKLALTVYHNEDGITSIPLWLKNNLVEYKIFFRLHGWCGTGAVIYGLPKQYENN